MKRSIFVLAACLILVLGFLSFEHVLATQQEKRSDSVGVVLVGTPEAPAFEQSVEKAKSFYDIFRDALDMSKVGDYDAAIKLYNEAISHAALGPELAMVYGELTKIYRAKGDLESELKYLRLDIKYSLNQDLNKEHQRRVDEINQILAPKDIKQ